MPTITLFHGTTKKIAETIIKEGLKANSYLTSREDVAEYYAEVAMEDAVDKGDADADCVILSVIVKQNDLRVDYCAYEEPLTYYRNDFTKCDSEWHEGVNNGDIPYPKDIKDTAVALSVTGCVKTQSLVTSKYITIYE